MKDTEELLSPSEAAHLRGNKVTVIAAVPRKRKPKCIVCGGYEPCSHDFDQIREELSEIGRNMGSLAQQEQDKQ